MRSWSLIVFSCVTLSVSAEQGFQYVNNYYKRKSYENANFDELFEDFSVDPEDVSKHEYRFIINKGLSTFFLISDRIEKLKRGRNENSVINDQLKFNAAANAHNFTFHSVVGLALADDIDATLVHNESLPYFEVKSKIYLPSITFKGIAEYGGLNQSLDYEMGDILYSDLQRKKLSDDYEIKLFRSCEKFQVNTTKMIVRNAANIDAEYRQLESEVTKEISRYLPKVVEQVKVIMKNLTLPADIRYLQVCKEKNVRKLSTIISSAIRTYGMVNSSIPRFSFVDESSSTTFDLISGVFEVDLEKTNVSLSLERQDEFAFTTPAEGMLTYFVTEQNCTEFCNTYGDRAKVRAINAQFSFYGKKIEKVYMVLDLEPGNTFNDHYLRRLTESTTKNMVTKISKILSERLSTRLKNFLK